MPEGSGAMGTKDARDTAYIKEQDELYKERNAAAERYKNKQPTKLPEKLNTGHRPEMR